MGFSCGFYKVKNLDNLTVKQINAIESYYNYYDNPWAMENYDTWQEYSRRNTSITPVEVPEVTQEQIDLYKNEYVDREFNKSIFEEFDTWCSNGSCFHDWFITHCEPVEGMEEVYKVTKQNVIDALHYTYEKITDMEFTKVLIKKAFIEDEDTEEIKLIPCTGVEIELCDGNIPNTYRREYTDDIEYSNVYCPIKYFDEWEYDAFIRLLYTLIRMLTEVDFDKEIVIYE